AHPVEFAVRRQSPDADERCASQDWRQPRRHSRPGSCL
ncbi:MAG: hypothetical protein AVDCRST_MAG42-3001, partial [uncultured Chthoniobacterales bacterium]